MLLISIIVICAVLTISAGSATKSAADASWGFSLTNLDRSCKGPVDDFYEFAMGGWMKANTIPAEYSTWGSFTVLRDKKSQRQCAQFWKALGNSKSPPPDRTNRKSAIFYSSCMNTAPDRRPRGASHLLPISPPIEAIQDRKGLDSEVARLHRQDNNVAFGFGATPDFKNSFADDCHGAPGRIGYAGPRLLSSATTKSPNKLREGYLQHIAKMFELSGDAS